MDNKQAAAVLRTIVKARRMPPSDKDQLEFAEAEERGADALEMLEWLFEVPDGLIQKPRCCVLYKRWVADDTEMTFPAFCEAKFEESKKHGL